MAWSQPDWYIHVDEIENQANMVALFDKVMTYVLPAQEVRVQGHKMWPASLVLQEIMILM